MLYDEQQIALDNCVEHLTNPTVQVKVFEAAGGTGKTTVIRHVVKKLSTAGKRGLVCAFTGRASSQLRKGGLDANTFHSVMYQPVIDSDGFVVSWRLKNHQELLESVGDFIICDEASMVNYETVQAMLSVGVPVLMVGDGHQLPPVEMNDRYKSFNPMSSFEGEKISLKVNRRIVEGKEGLEFINQHLRENETIPRRKMNGYSTVTKRSITVDYLAKNKFDIILCGMNKTRKRLNELTRQARGYSHSDIPLEGERVVCLRNGQIGEYKISNGDIFDVDGVIQGEKDSTFMLTNIDTGDKINVSVWNETWKLENYPEGKRPRAGEPTTHQIMTFGYCISTHKAQGSTFGNVLFYDEDVSFFLNQQQFRYTAASRAADNLVVVV